MTTTPVEINKYSLKKNDVLFNRTNTVDLVGKTAIYKGEYPAIYTGYLIKINNNEDILNSEYLNYVLNSHQIKSYNRLVLSVAVSQANINAQKLKTYPIPIPPSIGEQTAIANALSDVDALLTELENLIAKKQAMKTATMQQLLTGKTRLPQFAYHEVATNTEGAVEGKRKGTKPSELGEIPEDWGVGKLNDVCFSFKTGKLDANAMKKDGEYRFYTCAREHYYIDHYAFDTEALLVSGNGANVGYVHYFKGKFNAYQRTYVLSGFNADVKYLKIYLEEKLAERIRVEVNSGNTPYITMDTLTDMLIALPAKGEQNAIANMLSDMDNEIQTLEQRLSKTRQIKQGMMQELLTGKTRLPFDKIADKE
ncbi:restriction endonuclease subunit S [Shewanella baltica]|uniref:restriction endonuclease subunit S n=1 Tax=Shewanella baltica TaxID=62322 RepID=UPI00217D0A28|nr:restriction endonuclease subunit S [Shewanella baltica]MCS6095842.1 restriction endonuclease subunit S [Shewanella baltica]MCS6226697.1 restriction endonuclease subunit S [Shewanella baltica]